METRSPSITRIVTMTMFALSCAGLLLFLWLSFGGTLPFNPQGYEVRISFPYADQLATQADVRIAGVSVGQVIGKSLDPQGNRTIATIQMQKKFAPLHEDVRAILRQKTILGETYVELTPGSPGSPTVPDGGLLPGVRSRTRSSSTRSSTRWIQRRERHFGSGSRSWPGHCTATLRTSTTCWGISRRSRPTPATSSRCSTSSTVRW